MTTRPASTEAAAYYFTYIDQVADGDICDTLAAQRDEAVSMLRAIAEGDSLHRYALGKWSLRDLVCHLSDAERLFQYRAYWFARGFDSPLPSFDESTAVAAARADGRAWHGLIDEFDAVRAATIPFFRSLSPDDWNRHGIASDNPFTVRALAFITAGHVAHHLRIVREGYLPTMR
jgi:hypothetical protein